MQSRILTVLALLGAFLLAAAHSHADDWPQWRGPRRDGVWREEGIVETMPPKLEFRWRTKIGEGYAGPAVAGGRVFLLDRVLDEGQNNPDNPFARSPVGGVERVLCLDAADGGLLWKKVYPCRYTISYPSGPRATPTVHEGRVYTVGAMGHLFCLEEESGKELWARDYARDFGAEITTWGIAGAPLVDGERLILLTGGKPGACVVALDRRTGTEIWRSLEVDDPGYCPPMIYEAGGVRQLIIWTPRFVASLNPATGAVYWREPFAVQAGLTVATPIFHPDRRSLFLTAFYNGPLMLELNAERPEARVLWRGKSDSERKTDILHGLMCTPVFRGDYIYGVGSYGQLRCIDATAGERVWETFDATGFDRWWNAFIIPHGDRYFIPNEQGEIITAELSPKGYRETGRARLIDPTNPVRRRKVVWSHPAFALQAVFARNNGEIVCASLAADDYAPKEAEEASR